ncbi:hypothetical protein DC094_01375 [Pelagibaculum spongiae]|uniref:FCP1 homology domain-containing protein n=2 Tax=Pelagibaculum spongiae TaxID=2080658 RepID=A0A2V1GY56_9GAMM|nr:hypothetical protein DC094_01375 [Pelagibaculum spongiae]
MDLQQPAGIHPIYWFFFDLDQTLLCIDRKNSKEKLSRIQSQHLSDSEIVDFSTKKRILALYAQELPPILQILNRSPLVSFNILTTATYDCSKTIIPFIEETYLNGGDFKGKTINRTQVASFLEETNDHHQKIDLYSKGNYIKKLLHTTNTTYQNHHVILIDDKITQRESAKRHNFIVIDPTQPDFIDQLTSLVSSIAHPDTSTSSEPWQPLRRSARIRNK